MDGYLEVPSPLRRGAFPLSDARRLGLTADDMRRAAWVRVAHGWYRWRGCPPRDEDLLTAIAASLPPGGAFAGLTAAARWGFEASTPKRPVVAVPVDTRIAHRAPATVHCVHLTPSETVMHEGYVLTTPVRTCFDLAAELTLTEAVAAIDSALHRGLLELDEFESYVARRRGIHGVVKARRVVPHLEPLAESPMESRLRMLLVRARLPRPQAQTSLIAPDGRFIARVDLYYPDAKLAIEYDGEQHREQMTADLRRQNLLADLGIRLLRYTAPDLRDASDRIVHQVRSLLQRRQG